MKQTKRKRWIALARCLELMLANLAVAGLGLGFFKGETWPAMYGGLFAAFLALTIAWSIPND